MNYTYRLAAAIMAVFLAGSAVRNSALSAPQQGEYATLAAAITAQYELIHDVMFSYVQVSRKDNVTVAGTLRFKQPNMFKSEIEVTGANPGYVLRNVSVFDGKFLWQQQTVSGDPSVRVIKSNLDAKQRQSESLLEQVDVCRQFSALKRDYEIISVREDRFEQRPVSVLKFRIRAEARAGMLQRLKASHSFDADNFPEEKNFYWDDAARFCAKLETLNNKQAVISTITYRGVIVNAQPEDSIFSYTPPDKAVIMDMTGVIGREIKRPEYNGTENEKAGTPGPGFALPDLFGKLFDSARVRGKIVVIGFWLAQSPECRGAVALLDTLLSGYRRRR
jgi:Outer membrane lipoprotein-sorting protein